MRIGNLYSKRRKQEPFAEYFLLDSAEEYYTMVFIIITIFRSRYRIEFIEYVRYSKVDVNRYAEYQMAKFDDYLRDADRIFGTVLDTL